MTQTIWNKCNDRLADMLTPQQFHTWIRPLSATIDRNEITIFAPNRFVLDYVNDKFHSQIIMTCTEIIGDDVSVKYSIFDDNLDSSTPLVIEPPTPTSKKSEPINVKAPAVHTGDKTRRREDSPGVLDETRLNPTFTFDYYVEGKSNQLARAAARQVAENPGPAYNPLFIYGGVGLGKTHLMHAVGNQILQNNPQARIVYLHSERFVTHMIKALQHNNMDDFKNFYRSLDVLLIDDIQFFAGKERTQEEFFHTFNALLECKQRVIITCDKFPKEVNGLESRLKSRLGWGLSVCIDPPDFETRVAILQKKAIQQGFKLTDDVAYFIAKKIKSNVRELEGALNTLWANSNFMRVDITLDFTKETLKELFNVHHRHITIENIQKHTANYYNIKLFDLLSKKRTRSLARPRQMAMFLAKELTDKSLPEIGENFGGRDHTTVLYAHKKITQLFDEYPELLEDKNKLITLLTS